MLTLLKNCVKSQLLMKRDSHRSRQDLPNIYFAYGSNMNHDQMVWRCPTARFLGAFYLEDWCLTMRSHATVIREPGSSVPGALWQVQPKDIESLDRYEGLNFYYKRTVLSQQNIDFFLYEMIDLGQGWPSSTYLDSILSGYEHCGIPQDHFQPLMPEW